MDVLLCLMIIAALITTTSVLIRKNGFVIFSNRGVEVYRRKLRENIGSLWNYWVMFILNHRDLGLNEETSF